jgi:hypothetical protein
MTDNKFSKVIIFNLEAAVEAASTMPTATGRNAGVKSELGNHIVDLLKAVGKPLACKQIAEALQKGGLEVTTKMVSDKCWALEKKGLLTKTATGVYAAPVEEATEEVAE